MKVLFLCTENSARSIMAEALLKHHGQGEYDVYSAGTSPAGINAQARQALEHFGLSINGLFSKNVSEFAGEHFDYVITLCEKAGKECNTEVTGDHNLAWDFPEPRTRKDNNPYEKTLQELNSRLKMFLLIQEKQKPAPITPTLFYKSLADDIRLKTLVLIAVEKELCVCELMAALKEESQPKVSRHLAQLKKAGILSSRKHQQWVYYSVNPELPHWMQNVIKITIVNEPHFIDEELAQLNAMGDRPTRVETCCA